MERGSMKLTLEKALEAFEAESRSLGHSPEYTRVTFVFLRKFRGACEALTRYKAEDMPVKAITPACITGYFTCLQGLGQGSQNRGLAALRTFLDYLEQREELKPGASAKLLKGRKHKTAVRKRKHYIPAEQFGEMLDLAGKRHPADRAAVAVALYTLARQGEIASIRLKDVDIPGGVIRIHRHKRNRWTDVTICPDLNDELMTWLWQYANAEGILSPGIMRDEHPGWYLIPHLVPVRNKGTYRAELIKYAIEPDKPLARLENIVKNGLDILGADTEDGVYVRHLGEGMHTIRRSGARAMFDYLADEVGEAKSLLQVSIMLDHDDPQMTLRYIDRDVERDRLNKFLKTGSMYGPAHRRVNSQSNVLPLRKVMEG
jgi:integrase